MHEVNESLGLIDESDLMAKMNVEEKLDERRLMVQTR